MNTKSKGDLSESIIISEFLRLGIPVSIPFGDNQKYDLIIDVDGVFKSVQVKTGRYRDGVVAASIHGSVNTKNVKKENRNYYSYKGKVDYIAIYCDELRQAYIIKPEDFGDRDIYLRVDSPKNNQEKGINWAKDYILERSLIG